MIFFLDFLVLVKFFNIRKIFISSYLNAVTTNLWPFSRVLSNK